MRQSNNKPILPDAQTGNPDIQYMKTMLMALIACLIAIITPATKGALVVTQQSDLQFSTADPVANGNWMASLWMPAYYDPPDTDFLLAGLYELAQENQLDEGLFYPNVFINDGNQVMYRLYVSMTIKTSGQINMIVSDTVSAAQTTISGTLSGAIAPGQDIWIRSYADTFPLGETVAYALSVREGLGGPVTQVPGQARATSAGTEAEMTSFLISGWSGDQVTLGFYAGNILTGNLADFRTSEITIVGVVPEPGPSVLAMAGGLICLFRRRRR